MTDRTSKDDLAFALDTIRREIQSWLDWQASERRHEGIETSDETHLMRVPVWPTRGVLKNWVAALERAHGAVETPAPPINPRGLIEQLHGCVTGYTDRKRYSESLQAIELALGGTSQVTNFCPIHGPHIGQPGCVYCSSPKTAAEPAPSSASAEPK